MPGPRITLGASAVVLSLALLAPVSGGELGWRKPQVPSAGPSAAERADRPSAAPRESSPIRPVTHEASAAEVEGPRLVPATGGRDAGTSRRLVADAESAGGNGLDDIDERSGNAHRPRPLPADGEPEEPRQLKSVLVRTSSSAAAVAGARQPTNQTSVDGTGSPQSGQPAPPRRLTLSEVNVLRTAGASSRERESASAKPLDRDPFETAGWSSRIKSAQERESSPLRLAQNLVEEPTRSVLVHDPFEDAATSQTEEPGPELDQAGSSGRFVSQPMPMDGPDTAQPLPEREFEPGLGFERFGGESLDSQDRSLDAERGRAEETCKEALAILARDTISTIDLGIRVDGEVGVDVPFECALDKGDYIPRNWSDVTFMWKASALCHKPLYFENVQLERYGHSWGWHLQPLISAAHFFGTVPILPYKMGLTPPNECIYALGYYRPGNCAPYLIEPLGTHPRAVVWQAGAIVGAAAIVP